LPNVSKAERIVCSSIRIQRCSGAGAIGTFFLEDIQITTIKISKIISGGQTGADQAALDAAAKIKIPYGGWIPKGRKTEAGRLPDRYRMCEMPTKSYALRTEQNVVCSDGTLIISHGPLSGGSKYTQAMAAKHSKPYLHINLCESGDAKAAESAKAFVKENKIKILNVAGPRASEDPRIYLAAMRLITRVLSSCGRPHLQNKRIS
jgi:hypothetical protein